MPRREGLALHRAAAGVAARGPLLEIGTYCGKSTIYLGAAARVHGAVVVTVDHHRGSEEHQPGEAFHDPTLIDERVGCLDTLPRFRRTIHDAGLEDHVVAVVGRSTQVASLWSTPLALLFIDGGHSEEAARADYRCWSPHLLPGGRLVLHDVHEDPTDGGRAPYHVYQRALSTGAFLEEEAVGSLRILRRTGEPG